MDTSFGSQNSQPPAGYFGDVWPPPPSNEGKPALVVPFKTIFQRVVGSVPDFRTGNVQVTDDGILIQGKAITPYEKQMTWLILSLFVRLFLIVALVYEYALRKDCMLTLGWDQVREIVTVPKKNRVSVVYDAPNYKGIVKPYSLTFDLAPTEYETFTAAAEHFISSRVHTGKLRFWTSPPSIIFLCALGVGVCVVIFAALTSSSS